MQRDGPTRSGVAVHAAYWDVTAPARRPRARSGTIIEALAARRQLLRNSLEEPDGDGDMEMIDMQVLARQWPWRRSPAQQTMFDSEPRSPVRCEADEVTHEQEHKPSLSQHSNVEQPPADHDVATEPVSVSLQRLHEEQAKQLAALRYELEQSKAETRQLAALVVREGRHRKAAGRRAEGVQLAREQMTASEAGQAPAGPRPHALPDAGLQHSYCNELHSRIGILLVLLVLQSASSFILSAYDELLALHPQLVQFLTMLVSSRGNAGNQAAVLVIRALATGSLTRAKEASYIKSEMLMALGIGLLILCAGVLVAGPRLPVHPHRRHRHWPLPLRHRPCGRRCGCAPATAVRPAAPRPRPRRGLGAGGHGPSGCAHHVPGSPGDHADGALCRAGWR